MIRSDSFRLEETPTGSDNPHPPFHRIQPHSHYFTYPSPDGTKFLEDTI
jgi:hypothetical protein